MYIRRPLQSVERVRVQPAINLLSSSQSSNNNGSIQQQLSKAQQLKAAKQPSQQSNSPSIGSKATAQAALGDSGLQQPRQDAANLINYLLIGATGFRHRPPQAAELEPPRTRLSSSIDAPARTGVPIGSFGYPTYPSGAQMTPKPSKK